MAKRRMGIIAAALWVLLCLTSLGAQAASTTDAREPIRIDMPCTLALHFGYDGVDFPGLEVKLYKVADVSTDFQYTLTDAFAPSGQILNGVQSQGEWNVIRMTLEAYIVANAVPQTHTETTDENGMVQFSELTPGLYMLGGQQATQDTLRCYYDSALIALPGLGEDGLWQYQVSATPKAEGVPDAPDGEIQLKVLKLWRGDEEENVRPQSITVEIFRGGISYATVTLSEENQWSHSWTAENDGTKWTVAERNVPEGYTVTVERRENSFVLVNSYGTEDPNPNEPPKTGDTSRVLIYMVPLYVSGIGLIILGAQGKRKRA